MDKEYDPTEVLVDSDNSNSDNSQTSDDDDVITNDVNTTHEPEPAIAHQATDNDILDKLCMPCVGSKSTRTIRRDKSMTTTTSKLEKVHADLWGPHEPPSC